MAIGQIPYLGYICCGARAGFGLFYCFWDMMTFVEKEKLSEKSFDVYGPFWHIYTDGTIMEDIFRSDDGFREGMIALAVSAVLFGKAELITFELMNNHVHLIMRGAKEDCIESFEIFKRRLRRHLRYSDQSVDWKRFEPGILKIESLKSLRNEIIYVNRNAYVAHQNHTPFSYPWGGGWAFFSPVIYQLPVKDIAEIKVSRVRELTHYRDINDLARLKFVGDVPFIPSFCRVDIGQSMFHSARSYFGLLTRNAEAFSQIASRLKDSVFLTDDEMFLVAVKTSEDRFSTKIALLTPEQKIQLARILHFDYNASNNQLRRILKLEMSVLNELFPQVFP